MPPISSLHGYGGEHAPETLIDSARAALRRDVLSLAFAPGSASFDRGNCASGMRSVPRRCREALLVLSEKVLIIA